MLHSVSQPASSGKTLVKMRAPEFESLVESLADRADTTEYLLEQ